MARQLGREAIIRLERLLGMPERSQMGVASLDLPGRTGRRQVFGFFFPSVSRIARALSPLPVGGPDDCVSLRLTDAAFPKPGRSPSGLSLSSAVTEISCENTSCSRYNK